MAVNLVRRKELYELMPEGIITTRKWLLDHHFSRHAIDNFVKSNQLTSISNGVYVRNTTKISWQSVVFSLQSILKTDLVIGGLSALEMQGLAHYLSLSDKKTVHLYGNDKLPDWSTQLSLEINFIKHTTNRLFDNKSETNKQTNYYTVERDWNASQGKLIIATPERAYLELLLEVPTKISFEHADQLMQGLTTLSPRRLQLLLESCQSVKVKRLFLWFAERHNYVWLHKIDRSKITLGAGNRMIAKDGKLDNKFKITVPVWL